MNSFSGGRLSNNEKEFIQAALRAEQRIDGRRPFDARRLTINFAKEDGAVEVQQGRTRVTAIVTGTLGAPYPDRPTEGSLNIFTEFSPLADPGFDSGRPGELAIELGRIIDRGLRESRAVDTESLCVLAGRAVWTIRVDIHILDNGGNLVDVANIAALAALASYRRPDCTIGGHDGQEVIVHPPEVREPVSLILHHYPIAVSFAFFGDGDIEALDPTVKEEAVMGGRLTVIVNSQGDICAIQKGGGVGVRHSEIMRCIRIASSKAVEVTNQLKKAIEANGIERAKRKIKRHPDQSMSEAQKGKAEATQDIQMEEVSGVSADQDERREAVMEILRTEEMEEEPTISEVEEEDDIPVKVDGKKQKLNVGGKDIGGMKVEPSGKEAPLGGGFSLWANEAVNGAERNFGADSKQFDSDAIKEFEQVSEAIQGAKTQEKSIKATSSPLGLLDSGSLATMAAATVYAHMAVGEFPEGSRPLGPVFPKVEADENGQRSTLDSIKPVPTSLLDAVKKPKKRKK
ncbi:hypothetical protein R1flu_018243 [Riccia fluitans]|uniref:Protein ECERIFERUM 7 n=1 Tax=Riccia fluitans TaxID=41844 RepID=A0ABD1ZFA0_9MARC